MRNVQRSLRLNVRCAVAVLLLIVVAVGYMPMAAAQEITYRFQYMDPENTILTGYVGTLPEILEIPASVTTIAKSAFANNQTIKEVIATPRLIKIEYRAFAGCSSLESVSFPRIQYIGSDVFSGCYAIDAPTLGDDLQIIGDHAFASCNRLRELVLPNSLETIGDGAFYRCTNLKSITIPNSVTQIGKDAFNDTGLMEAYLGDRITNIPARAFYGCESLEDVHMGESVQIIGERTFGGCKSLKHVALPDSVSKLDLHAFDGAGLVSVILPEGIYVGTEAFNHCTDLKYMYIPSDVRDITYGMIGVSNLQRVLFGGSVSEWDRLGLSYLENKGVQVIFNAERPDPKPPQIEIQPVSQKVEAGKSVSLSVRATVHDVFTDEPGQVLYQWQMAPGNDEWRDIPASNLNYAGCKTNRLDILSSTATMNGWQYRCVVTNAADRTKVSVSDIATLNLLPSSSVPSGPTVLPAPVIPEVTGYESGRINGRNYYVKTAGALTMYYLRSLSGRMVRVSAPYTTAADGTRFYPVNYGGAVLFPRLEDGRIFCYCLFAEGLETPVLNVISAPKPVYTDGYQTGRINGRDYYIKTSGASLMFYLKSRSGRMVRVSAPYVTAADGTRYYPVNHGGAVLFPKLSGEGLASYETGSGQTVLTVI